MCPRLGGSAFFESGQRDLGVSSKAHKFACELRALLASDKHLRSAERSERQLPTPNTPASARGTVAVLWAAAAAPTHRGIVCVGIERVAVDCASILPDSELA